MVASYTTWSTINGKTAKLSNSSWSKRIEYNWVTELKRIPTAAVHSAIINRRSTWLMTFSTSYNFDYITYTFFFYFLFPFQFVVCFFSCLSGAFVHFIVTCVLIALQLISGAAITTDSRFPILVPERYGIWSRGANVRRFRWCQLRPGHIIFWQR